ncbi:hypothetical protein A2954_01335 [Candidatus Roizmanbacteria bacterium RIFCSPLOWO2_01_FULL_37_12]|uniref:Uncharacterized protein n=1 Tax=Candidatus Roizmanbacteria bacterium RIFCSPLOWO2_01_FULL_37_12 TaxID=1802056 RepID=A0A1F7IGI5_9BACT|nr:MAG: hypothetical protein A3D76_05955 [Candidatus Roizmanbacteria bacterium RIFCSPHIGHO2_02_FULL_37_9b]OGK42468.1 MAG: hypothetical protein A2954_01335 [Candidatus Roizmanbacteria bacterium RIFCSPLOWO2_01_FULL_37_12]
MVNEQQSRISEKLTEILELIAPCACPEVADRKTQPQGTGRVTIEMLQQNALNIKCRGEVGQIVCALCLFYGSGRTLEVQSKV